MDATTRFVTTLTILGAAVISFADSFRVIEKDIALPERKSVPYVEPVMQYASLPNDTVPVPENVSEEDRQCLALNIYFEAKNQSISGQLAVGIVTLRRAAQDEFPDDVCGVTRFTHYVTETGLPERHRCHFSWYCDGKPDRPVDLRAWDQAQVLADALLSKESAIVDFTGGADHYHADYIEPPYWTANMVRVAQIQNHIFYMKTSL